MISRKRARVKVGAGGLRGPSGGWDKLPWKTLDPHLERDNGLEEFGVLEDQAFLYTLEELSGEDYAIQQDALGGFKVQTNVKPDPSVGVSVARNSDPTEGEGVNDSEVKRDEQKTRKKARKSKEQPSDGADATRGKSTPGPEKGAPTAAKQAGTDKSDDVEGKAGSSPPHKKVVSSTLSPAMAQEGQRSAAGSVATEGALKDTNAEKRPRRKKRRGQGKKKAAAQAQEAAAIADQATVQIPFFGTTDKMPKASAEDVDDAVDKNDDRVVSAKSQRKSEGQDTTAGNKAKQSKSKGGKHRNKKAPDDGEEDAESATEKDAVALAREAGWELSAEDAEKMLPWTFLGVDLHPALTWHLNRQGFRQPTPIQKLTLPKAMLGRKDIIGAAETGSGKTLAYGLPLLSEILKRGDSQAAEAQENSKPDATRESSAVGEDGGPGEEDRVQRSTALPAKRDEEGLQALVLCPTRELALQVSSHLKQASIGTGLSVVAVVGGLAEVKQERQLSRRPEVVVATPGRFWEMAKTHAHLSHLETLRHLVIDEADRMLQKGHYPELERLFNLLDRFSGRGRLREGDGDNGNAAGRARYKGRRAKRMNLGQPFASVDELPFDGGEDGNRWDFPGKDSDEDDNDDEEEEADAVMGDESMDTYGDGEIDFPDMAEDPFATGSGILGKALPPPKHSRQTYVFSATLTLGSAGRKQSRARGKKPPSNAAVGEDPIAKIMKRVGVRGEPVVIDMGKRQVSAVSGNAGHAEDAVEDHGDAGLDAGAGRISADGSALPALPSALRLCSIKSLQMDKDVHAYLFCALYPGRTLIFVNAIACARRLAVLLCMLKVPCTPLHAQMQQRQRLKSLDRFSSDPKAVLIATDVAARGLDIPKVDHVVHYDAARSAEVFIHRAGRTARARASGLSLSVVAPRDDPSHRQICSVLGLHDGMEAFPLDLRLVDRARERVGMALKVMKFQHNQSKISASNDFFRGLSRDAELIMDRDLIMDDLGGAGEGEASGGAAVGVGRKGKQHGARVAAEARAALEASLSRPLFSDRRKLIPVAQALSAMKESASRTAAGDLVANRISRKRRANQ